MNPADTQLIDDVITLTAAAPPEWLDERAPVLQARQDDSIYFIGVIGGKDVGKSSLINALLGKPIARVTSFGEGTARALAYAYRGDASRVRDLLSKETPDQFDVVEHDIASAAGRVLLDLPDIDSVWDAHVELTRRLLRHMLYPVWVQSIEKYADRESLQLLAKVVEGNAPENLLFVLTKADQLAHRHGDAAVGELKADYAGRLTRVCGLSQPPQVFAVDNRHIDSFDLPDLQRHVLASRSAAVVSRSRDLATRRQRQTVIRWLDDQKIEQRLAAAHRLLEDAEASVSSRLAEPIVDDLSLRFSSDGAVRAHVIEPVVRSRLSYWPIVNVIDAVLGPLVSMVRGGTTSPVGSSLGGRDLANHVRGVFADLSQRNPQVLALYSNSKLWENDPAQLAASVLQQRVESAVESHRTTLLKTESRPSMLARLLAPVVTIGAALWFPIVQPILEIVLSNGVVEMSRESMLLVVRLLSGSELIKSVGFLAIYFVALWMWLRWLAYRRIDRALRRSTDADHPAASVMAWNEQLLEPIRRHVQRLTELKQRIDALRDDDRAAA